MQNIPHYIVATVSKHSTVLRKCGQHLSLHMYILLTIGLFDFKEERHHIVAKCMFFLYL